MGVLAQAKELERDAPEAYIPSDRRQAIAGDQPLPDRTYGAGLFADISGFTALTEALATELGGQRASEELTAHLNRVFHAVIAELDRFGGSVIYFSGDAITCWVDGDDGLRATAAAFAMQDAMARERLITTPGGLVVALEIKIAVAVGTARRFLVGDPDIQLIDALAGSVIDRLAATEEHADKGEVVLDETALEALGDRVELTERRREGGETFGVARRLRVPVPEAPLAGAVRPLEADEIRPWLLEPVYERLRAGRGEFLAELRPAVPLFLRFGGIDFDRDDRAGAKLDDFVRRTQRVLTEYGGSVLQLTIGDKGAYLYAIFGAPLAHENDAARAVAAGLELCELERDGAISGIQVGITCGRLRSGTYGHALRRTYCCLGDAVNLAARLMSKAPPGAVLVDAAIHRSAGETFESEELPPLRLKGKRQPVKAYKVTGLRRTGVHLESRYELPMFGRRAELAEIGRRLDDARIGNGQVVAITAEAGMGKSRLVAEAVRAAAERGVAVHAGECQAFGTNTSYFVWQSIWSSLLGVDGGGAERVEHALREIDERLAPRAPLLGGLLGIPIPDNDLTRAFDAKLRKESLEGLLTECLRARAQEGPLVLVLEDCHWIDPLSRDLLAILARDAARLPVMLLLAYRPAADRGEELGVERLPHFSEIELPELERADAELLIGSKVQQLFGDHLEAPPRRLVELVTERAQGNAFYIEELIAYIRSEGVDPRDDRALAALELPDSLHSLILSLIDTLAEQPRRTLKIASVVGRLFRAPTLPGVYPELGRLEQVIEYLTGLCESDLVSLEHEADQAYLFNHVVTQQVAYESIPFAMRAALHENVGAHIEATEPSLERQLDLLAHHYWLSDNVEKKREYLRRAGDAAQAEYANDSAIEYYRRLLPLVPEAERGPLLLKLGKVLELIGEWEGAGEAYSEALELAGDDVAARAWAEAALGELARKRGRFDDAAERLDRAARGFAQTGQDEGTGVVLHQAGTVAAQRGDYDAARASYEASLEIRRRLGDKACMGGLLSNLAIIAEYTGDYPRARQLLEEGIGVRVEAGDRWGTSVSMNNLGNIARLQGDLPEARERLEEALVLQCQVGDRWMIANVQNNLANVLREQREMTRAATLYADALRVYGDYADSWALAFLFEDVATLAAAAGDARQALRLAGAAETRRTQIGTPRSPADEEKLQSALAPAHERLRDGEAAAAREEGRSLTLEAAVEEALEVCRAELFAR